MSGAGEGRELPVTLATRLAAGGALPAEDLLHAMLPLMQAVAQLHGQGRVADLGPETVVDRGDGGLVPSRPGGIAPRYDEARLRSLQPHAASALHIVGEYRIATDAETGSRIDDLRVRGAGPADGVRVLTLRPDERRPVAA